MAEKAIRDVEREQWARMSEYLSPYELREYKLEHAQLARDMRPELEWFKPNKGEFVTLYTYREKKADLLDETFGGDTKLYSQACQSALDRRMTIQQEVMEGKLTPQALEEGCRRMNALEGKDMDCWRAEVELQSMAREMMGRDRWESFLHGPYGQEQKAISDELLRLDNLHYHGQISEEELHIAEYKLLMLPGRGLSEEEIAEYL